MATFKKIVTVNKGDYEEVYSNDLLMGTIREHNGLWKVVVLGSIYAEVVYLETRAAAAEYACIIYWYIHGKRWYTDV